MPCYNGSCSRPAPDQGAPDLGPGPGIPDIPWELDPTEVGRLKPLKKKASADPAPVMEALKRPFAALSAWDTREVAPALRVQVRKGHNVSIEPLEGELGWIIRPEEQSAGVGVLPLIPLAAKGGLLAIGTRMRRDQQIRRDPWGQHEDDDEASGFGPGVGAVLDDDSLVLIDTDGYRVGL